MNSKLKVMGVGVLILVIAWALLDWPTGKSDLRAFDPREVARLETAMWRSYYEERRASLFAELTQLLRTQYHFSHLRAVLGAARAARAAFIFRRGHNRMEYERALPSLVSYYEAISEKSANPFDASQAARLELEWWIVHRQSSLQSPIALYAALANLQACVYRASPDLFQEHARARGRAMLLRDDWAARGGVSEDGWKQIQAMLDSSWTSLHSAVQAAVLATGPQWCSPAK